MSKPSLERGDKGFLLAPHNNKFTLNMNYQEGQFECRGGFYAIPCNVVII